MKKLKKFLSASKINAVLFVLIVSLVLCATVGAAYAALSYFSNVYGVQVQMFDIGVSLLENNEKVSWRDYAGRGGEDSWDMHIPGTLLTHMLNEGEKLSYGIAYPEELSVCNSGNINTWVRVTIYKYWAVPGAYNADGSPVKKQGLDSAMIDLHLVNIGNAWIEDESARQPDRIVLYYHYLLHSANEVSNPTGAPNVTVPFTDSLTINSQVLTATDRFGNYLYDGAKFYIEARVDVVQEHNGQQAILSTWGRNVIIDEVSGTLTLS